MRVRLQSQIESPLEEMRVKLSIVVSNLLGQLVDAMTGRLQMVHGEMLGLQLELQVIDEQMTRLNFLEDRDSRMDI